MALDFNSSGSTQNVNFGSPSVLDDLSTFTFIIWLQRLADGAPVQAVGSRDHTNSGHHVGWGAYIINTNGEGQPSMVVKHSTTDAQSTGTAGDVPWNGVGATNTFLAYGFDGTRCYIWKGYRSQLATEVTYGTQVSKAGTRVSDASANFMVGNIPAPTPNTPLLGNASRVGVYNRLLTLEEIQTIQVQETVSGWNIGGCVLAADLVDNGNGGVTDIVNANNGIVTGASFTKQAPFHSHHDVNDSHIYFSPLNWDSDGVGAYSSARYVRGASTYARSNNPGAYFRTAFTVASSSSVVATIFDTSALNGLAAGDCPVIELFVNGVSQGRTQLRHNSSGRHTIPFAQSFRAGSYTCECRFTGIGYGGPTDRWTTPANSVKFLAVVADASNATITTPSWRSKVLLAYGASNVEGRATVASGTAASSQDSSNSFVRALAAGMGAEYGIVAYSGAGYARGEQNNVASSAHPSFYSATPANRFVDQYSNGRSRTAGGTLLVIPDLTVVQLGYNDGVALPGDSLTSRQVKESLEFLQSIGATRIVVCQHQSCPNIAAIDAGVAVMTDHSTVWVASVAQLITQGVANEFSYDGQHESLRGHMALAGQIHGVTGALRPTASEIADAEHSPRHHAAPSNSPGADVRRQGRLEPVWPVNELTAPD